MSTEHTAAGRAERAFKERERRRSAVDAPSNPHGFEGDDRRGGEHDDPQAGLLFEDQRRIAFGGLLRRELRGLIGEDQDAAARLAEVAADPSRRGAEEAAKRLHERRRLATEILALAIRHELVLWLRLHEIDQAHRAALGIGTPAEEDPQ